MIDQEPIIRSLYLSYLSLESTYFRDDLFLERVPGDLSNPFRSNSQSKKSNNVTIELMFAGVNMFLARLRLILARAAGEG